MGLYLQLYSSIVLFGACGPATLDHTARARRTISDDRAICGDVQAAGSGLNKPQREKNAFFCAGPLAILPPKEEALVPFPFLPSPASLQWWRNANHIGQKTTSHVHHLWRPSTSENNLCLATLLSRLLVHGSAAVRGLRLIGTSRRRGARDPRSELLTWQRLRCPKGSCIGKRGEGRWWVRSPANSQTSFSKGQKDDQTIGTQSLEPFEPLRRGASVGRSKRLRTDHCRSRTDLTWPSPPTR